MPVWLLPVINLVGPSLVRLAENIFSRKPEAPKTGPDKKNYVMNWLTTTWDLLEYLGFMPPHPVVPRPVVLSMLDGLIEGWVTKFNVTKNQTPPR